MAEALQAGPPQVEEGVEQCQSLAEEVVVHQSRVEEGRHQSRAEEGEIRQREAEGEVRLQVVVAAAALSRSSGCAPRNSLPGLPRAALWIHLRNSMED